MVEQRTDRHADRQTDRPAGQQIDRPARQQADQQTSRSTEKRIILEMGTGNDLYGSDYTKAACRAVHDALHHSSIVLFRTLGLDHHDMRVQVTIGVQQPDQVDAAAVAAELPRGRAEVTVVHGGLDVYDAEQGTTHVIAAAAIEAYLPIDAADWRLSQPRLDPA